MWQRLFAFVTAFAWLGWSAGEASAEQRLALVIGNSAYESNLPLSNPQNDAQAVAQLLNTAGFEVVMAFDLSRDIMKQTIEEFAARVGREGRRFARRSSITPVTACRSTARIIWCRSTPSSPRKTILPIMA